VATLSSPRVQSTPRNILRTIASYDWWLMLSAAILILFGLMSLYSINYDVPGPYFKRQLLNLGVGLVPFLIFLVVKPATWKKMAPILYAFCLGLLGMVLVMGEKKGGDAQRWIEIGPMQFQPSEMAKLLLVLTLASFWATRQDTAKKLSTFLLSFAHVAIPMLIRSLVGHLPSHGRPPSLYRPLHHPRYHGPRRRLLHPWCTRRLPAKPSSWPFIAQCQEHRLPSRSRPYRDRKWWRHRPRLPQRRTESPRIRPRPTDRLHRHRPR